MRRLLRYPLLSLAFLLLWLLLTESVSAGNILLGAALAVAGSGVLAAVRMPKGRLGALLSVPQLLFDVLVEKHENCLPMIPSGKPHNEMILPDFEDDIGAVIDAKGRQLV